MPQTDFFYDDFPFLVRYHSRLLKLPHKDIAKQNNFLAIESTTVDISPMVTIYWIVDTVKWFSLFPAPYFIKRVARNTPPLSPSLFLPRPVPSSARLPPGRIISVLILL